MPPMMITTSMMPQILVLNVRTVSAQVALPISGYLRRFARNHFDLAAIGFGNYRSPQSIGSLEGAESEPFVVRSAVSIARHDAMYRRERVARNGIPATAGRVISGQRACPL